MRSHYPLPMTRRKRTIFKAQLAAAALCAGMFAAQPAQATATLTCDIEDKTAKLSLQSVVSRGVGEAISGLNGALEIAVKGAPDDLRKIVFENAHLTQSWLHGRDLRLRLYRERADNAPHGYVELIIETRRAGKDEEAPYAGSYELIVHSLPSANATEGKTLKARGKAKCSVG